jgi:hypothetical protein
MIYARASMKRVSVRENAVLQQNIPLKSLGLQQEWLLNAASAAN